jgi:hypothetical protein
MEIMNSGSESSNGNFTARPVLTQTESNTTLWIGHLQTDPTDHFAGQTFKCPSAGQLDNIQVYSSTVHHPGHMLLTMHEFDAENKKWGPAIGNSTIELQRSDSNKWIRFNLQPVPLYKDSTYGFRLQTTDALIGIGEAASGTKHPFNFGQEWNGDSKNEKGHFFTYFSLAFKVELRA